MNPPSKDHSIRVTLPAADEIEIWWSTDHPSHVKIRCIGSPELLEVVSQWREKYSSTPIENWVLPKGSSRATLLLRRALLMAQGRWNLPYQEQELCHCRAVATSVVVDAITMGALTTAEVSQWTSASTSCGTCHKDVVALIEAISGPSADCP